MMPRATAFTRSSSDSRDCFCRYRPSTERTKHSEERPHRTGRPSPGKNCHFPRRSPAPRNKWPTRVHTSNDISTGSCVLADSRLCQSDRQTERQTWNTNNYRPHLCIQGIRCGLASSTRPPWTADFVPGAAPCRVTMSVMHSSLHHVLQRRADASRYGHRQHAAEDWRSQDAWFLRWLSRQTDTGTCWSQYSCKLLLAVDRQLNDVTLAAYNRLNDKKNENCILGHFIFRSDQSLKLHSENKSLVWNLINMHNVK